MKHTNKQIRLGGELLYEIYNGTDGGPYLAGRYLASAMTADGRESLCSSGERINLGVPGMKGGIIVFSTDIYAAGQSEDSLARRLYQEMEAVSGRLSASPVAWTIGYYLAGRYMSGGGRRYAEDSLSVAVVGVDLETLMKLALALRASFPQAGVLLKDTSSGKVLAADAHTPAASVRDS